MRAAIICLLLLAAHAAAGRELQQARAVAPTLYDCLTTFKLATFKALVDAAGLAPVLKNPKAALTLLAPDEAAFARLYADCKDKNVAKQMNGANVPPACSLTDLLKPAFRPKLLKLLQYHIMQGVVVTQVNAKTWKSGTAFNQLATLLNGQKIKLRYTPATKTYEAHGTGRDGFVRKGPWDANQLCGAGLLNIIDNVITLKPGTY